MGKKNKMKYILIGLILFARTFSDVWSSTSMENRADKDLELSFQVGLDYRMSPTQLGGMYFLNSNNLIGFKAGVDHQGQEGQTNISVQYKHYTGNSFYLASEIFYLNSRENLNESIFLNDNEEYARHVSLGAGIRVGNQWTWNNFTLGCDWFGLGRRLGTFKKETSNSNDTTVTLLNIIVGASF